MQELPFGTAIATARREIGLTQQDVIDRTAEILARQGRRAIGISYLSKLENNRMEPPSVPVIQALASVLKLDEDNLLAIAGRSPVDVGELLMTSMGARRFFRAAVNRGVSDSRWEQLLKIIATHSNK